jgi:hypothetical protein
MADAVEKVAARRFRSVGEKVYLSDRRTNHLRISNSNDVVDILCRWASYQANGGF